jgi:hypothetical protein
VSQILALTVVELCGSDLCLEDAAYVVHWPGRTIRMCGPCKNRALRIADAMGFALDVEPLPAPPEVAA